jgi:hypothetical protein
VLLGQLWLGLAPPLVGLGEEDLHVARLVLGGRAAAVLDAESDLSPQLRVETLPRLRATR